MEMNWLELAIQRSEWPDRSPHPLWLCYLSKSQFPHQLLLSSSEALFTSVTDFFISSMSFWFFFRISLSYTAHLYLHAVYLPIRGLSILIDLQRPPARLATSPVSVFLTFHQCILLSIKLVCLQSLYVLPLHTMTGLSFHLLSPLISFKCILPASSSALSRAGTVTYFSRVSSTHIPSNLVQCWLQGGGSVLTVQPTQAGPTDSHIKATLLGAWGPMSSASTQDLGYLLSSLCKTFFP